MRESNIDAVLNLVSLFATHRGCGANERWRRFIRFLVPFAVFAVSLASFCATLVATVYFTRAENSFFSLPSMLCAVASTASFAGLIYSLHATWRMASHIVSGEELEEVVRLYDSAIMSSTQGILIVDARHPDMPLVFVNEGFERNTGYIASEVIGVNCRILHNKENSQSELDKLRARLKKGMPAEVTLRNFKKDGTPFWNRLRVTPLHDANGQLTHFVGVQTDITAQKDYEEALHKSKEEAESANRAKSDFIATMSHEIRTPMQCIMGYSELLSKTQLSEKQAGLLKVIHDQNELLLQIINDILDFSKIQSGKLILENIPFDLWECVECVETMFLELARKKQLRLDVKMDESLPNIVMGDPVRIRQILINLTANALKFTQNGGVSIRVACCTDGIKNISDEIPAHIRFSVQDTGIGIAAEKQQHLFNPFNQIDSTITRKYGGSGMGLVISKRLCELMSGEISVKSELGRGSLFEFIIPLMPASENALQRNPQEELLFDAKKYALDILVVDDNPTALQLTGMVLDEFGIPPTLAESGVNALRCAERIPFHIIFMDLQMPEMDGFEAVKRLRQIESEKGRKPAFVIALTANASADFRQKTVEYKFDDFIAKPAKQSDINKALKRAVDALGNRVQKKSQATKKQFNIYDERAVKHLHSMPWREKKTMLDRLLDMLENETRPLLEQAFSNLEKGDMENASAIVESIQQQCEMAGAEQFVHMLSSSISQVSGQAAIPQLLGFKKKIYSEWELLIQALRKCRDENKNS